LFTSADCINKHIKLTAVYSAFLLLFGAVYEIFSHGVYSFHMIYAFAIPLLLCVVPYTFITLKRRSVRRFSLRLWSAAIVTFSTGCIVQGALDIFGTTNAKAAVFFVPGAVLFICGLFCLTHDLLRGYE